MRRGLGAEHPLCDRLQVPLLVLFFVVLGLDSLSFYIWGYSTVIFNALVFPWFFAGTILFFCFGVYLVSKSHNVVLKQVHDQPRLVDSGVYAWVRHPLYLGTLLFCAAFLFVALSLISIVVWIALFIFYDRMATYEEVSLIELLGDEYVTYQRRVSKWFPRLR